MSGTWIKVVEWFGGWRAKRFTLSHQDAACYCDVHASGVDTNEAAQRVAEHLQRTLPQVFPGQFPEHATIYGLRFLASPWSWEICAMHPSFAPVPEGNQPESTHLRVMS